MFKTFALLTCLVPLFVFSTAATSPEKARIVLTKANSVVLDSEFTDKTVAQVMLEAQIKHDALDRGDPLYLVLNSPGGSIEAGLELIDNLNALGRTIHTVSIFSASMGFQTVQGIPGTRYLTRTGTLMSHKAKGGFEGEFPGQIDSRYQYYLRRIGKLDEQTVARSGGKLTLASYQDLYENEYWCEGADCVAKGLADVVTLVACDKSLNGTKNVNQAFSFMGVAIKVSVTKAACPTITGTLSETVDINGKQVNIQDLDALAAQFAMTATQANELKKIIEKRLEELNPKQGR